VNSPAIQVRSRIPRIAEAARERARLTVVPRRRTAAGRAPFLALVSMVLLAGVVGLLLFNTSMQQASFATTALEEKATRLADRQQGLQMELERLRDPQRIASSAQKLGMVQACSPAFLRLGKGTVSGEPCAGTGANGLRINPRPPAKPAILTPPSKTITVPPSTNSSGDTTPSGTVRGAREGKKKNQ
jgi:cell division protein FtsL